MSSAKSVAIRKELIVSFRTFFQIFQQPRRIRKNRNYQKILLMQGDLFKVNLYFLLVPRLRKLLNKEGKLHISLDTIR